MKDILEKLFTAADNHGEDSGEPDHTVGDLQELLREAWRGMTISQKLKLLNSETVAQLAMAGSRGEFEGGDLTTQVMQNLAKMENAVSSAGYEIRVNHVDGMFFWESPSEASEDYASREDAVLSAFINLNAQ